MKCEYCSNDLGCDNAKDGILVFSFQIPLVLKSAKSLSESLGQIEAKTSQ